jgi:hypothetical protein
MKDISAETYLEGSACREAALRAYAGLRASGVVDLRAFEAAVTVYRHHHPESPPRQARHVVAEWLAPDA